MNLNAAAAGAGSLHTVTAASAKILAKFVNRVTVKSESQPETASDSESDNRHGDLKCLKLETQASGSQPATPG